MSMRAHSARLFAVSVVTALLASCGSPIVGAECREGFIDCEGACVNPERNPRHCGGCGQSCGAFTCEERECTTQLQPDAGLDGSLPDSGLIDSDGSVIDPDAGDTGVTNIGTGVPFLPDGGFMFPDITVGMSCPLGTIECSGACIDPNTSQQHCGGCEMACAADQLCALGECEDRCEAPLRLCDDRCLDMTSDASNCGSCGRACASGICELGACADAVPGHVVVIGHDYRSGSGDAMALIAGNALSLSEGTPVRAIAYRGGATNASVIGIRAALDKAMVADGTVFGLTEVSADLLPSRLSSARTLVIHAQDNATDAELQELGVRWGLALTQFVARGGTIVLFETQTARNAGTFQILEPSGLFSAESRDSIGAPNLKIAAPGDSVAIHVTTDYSSRRTTVRFLGVSSEGAVVVKTAADDAVVVHRVVTVP